MALTAGERLERYEIISLLGTSGVGEVYLEEDSASAANARSSCTNLTTEQIRSFAWSRDGKILACSRCGQRRDVVLMSNSR